MSELVRPLSPEEVQTIRELIRSRTVPAGIQRSPMKRENVVEWIRRFNQDRLAGLQERSGRGRQPQIREEQALAVVETVLAPAP
jgi:hypothetical protein